MKTNYLSLARTAFTLSLALLTLPSVGGLQAADVFTRVTESPGSDVGVNRGTAWGDYDNDGLIDLFVVNIGPGGTGPARHFLYHNTGNGTFSRVTNGTVAAVQSAGRGAVWGDYDNDGHLDLALTSIDSPNYLFRNNGDGSFAEVPGAAFVPDTATSRGVSWVDYDSDGYLDLFRVAVNQPRRLYHNNHDGTFTRITQGAFLTASGTFISAAWADYNTDGRPDLFLPNASAGVGDHPNYLYRNDPSGTLTRAGAGMVDGSSHSETAAWGDYDNDGDLDLFVSCALAPGTGSWPNDFYRNDGSNGFTSLASLPANDSEYFGGASRACTWGDYDNDGWLDLFVGNRAGQNDFLYHNNGDGTFSKITNSVAVSDGVDSHAAAWGDYDNDGFLDLFVGNFAGANFLYHNNTNENHWLKFRLIGSRSNRAAIGAKVRVRATINGESFWQMREVPGGDGSTGQNSLHVHVGLGDATNADLVRIEWPSGTKQELRNVAAGQFLTVKEPPALAALGQHEDGGFRLALLGGRGLPYTVEHSTNLLHWTWLTSFAATNNVMPLIDPSAIASPHRFYRAREDD